MARLTFGTSGRDVYDILDWRVAGRSPSSFTFRPSLRNVLRRVMWSLIALAVAGTAWWFYTDYRGGQSEPDRAAIAQRWRDTPTPSGLRLRTEPGLSVEQQQDLQRQMVAERAAMIERELARRLRDRHRRLTVARWSALIVAAPLAAGAGLALVSLLWSRIGIRARNGELIVTRMTMTISRRRYRLCQPPTAMPECREQILVTRINHVRSRRTVGWRWSLRLLAEGSDPVFEVHEQPHKPHVPLHLHSELKDFIWTLEQIVGPIRVAEGRLMPRETA